MSYSWGASWSNDTNAPNIPLWLYYSEKVDFVRIFIGAMSYGTLTCKLVYHARFIGSICWVRDCHCSVLQLHERNAQPRQHHEEDRQVGTHRTHYRHVLV